MKKLISILILSSALVAMTALGDFFKIEVQEKAFLAATPELKKITRNVWDNPSLNNQRTKKWDKMKEEGKDGRIEWCFTGWVLNKNDLGTVTSRLWKVSDKQTANQTTDKKVLAYDKELAKVIPEKDFKIKKDKRSVESDN